MTVLDKDESAVSLAGAGHDDPLGDYRWALEKPGGNLTIRLLGVGMRKVLRRSTDSVTWDRLAFERAAHAAAPGSMFVLAPSHRSYFDFLLASYVCFQHPELGIPVPHIAAADDFQRIPVVGRILRTARAFYIPRGRGTQVAEVNDELDRVVKAEGALMFFVEGQRSRSRLTLPPKRGLLRGLQATGQTFTILPIAISYDRVPEEAALEKELVGEAKVSMSLRAILRWLGELARGGVSLGRVHIACGDASILDSDTDVHALSERIVADQQAHTAVSRFHLRTFLRPLSATLEGVDESWLASAIEARGGRVLDSTLGSPERATPAFERSLRNQWKHWFFQDALALYPDHPVIANHVARHSWAPQSPRTPSTDPRVKKVVDALFAPILADYALTLRVLERSENVTPRSIVRDHPAAHLPVVEDALEFIVGEQACQGLEEGQERVPLDRARLKVLRGEWQAARPPFAE